MAFFNVLACESMTAECLAGLAVAAALSAATIAHASPNLSLDEPVYEELEQLQLHGDLPPYLGGFRPLTEWRARRLLRSAGIAVPDEPSGWWLNPVDRAALVFDAFREDDRPYSTAVRPRDVVGIVAMSCEHEEGRSCGNGVGAQTELDASAGYGPWVSGAIRVRPHTGIDAYDNGIDLDRAYVNAELGPAAIEAGRDVIALGPSSRTQVGWGDNAPPLDQVRLSSARPLEITDGVKGSFVYVLGRLRDPQTYPGTLVSIARGQLDLGDSVEIGGMQLLQVEGDGAPHLGFFDFIKEQVTRANASAGPDDSSNRRVGLDVAWRISGFDGARLYYQLMFEDWRKQFADALRYDADHVVGLEFSHGLLIEWQKTGFRSQEHDPRITGFTNEGRVVGSPLGPDAQALFIGGRIGGGVGTVYPWIELVRFSSDIYSYGFHQPIDRLVEGPVEYRARAGVRLRTPISRELRLDTEVMFEHVENTAFVTGANNENVGVTTTIVWQPRGRLP